MSTSDKTTDEEITWQWWDAQSRTLELLRAADHDLVCFRGGYGSGKTILGTRWIIETALTVPKSDNLIVAPDSAKGGPATYKTFFEQLPGVNTVPDEGGDPENSAVVEGYHAVEKRVTFANGSVVRLGSADVWNRYAGAEFNAVHADEVGHYDNTDLYDFHEMITSRQRTEDGPNITLWTSTGNGFDQFYDVTERQVNKDEEELAWKDSLAVVVADSRNNPFLEEKDKLRRQFEGTAREEQALKGGFSAAQGLVYPQFNRTDHVRSRDDVDVDDWRIYGYDYGWQDPRVLLELGKTPQGQYVALDCYYETNRPVEHCIKWLRDNGKPAGRIYCDHDPEHIDKFRQAGYDSKAANKDLDEGIGEVREVLEVDDEIGAGLLVTEHCTELIQEMQSYKEEDVGTSRAEDHVADCLRYSLMGDRYEPDVEFDTFVSKR